MTEAGGNRKSSFEPLLEHAGTDTVLLNTNFS